MNTLSQWNPVRERRVHTRFPYRMEVVLFTQTQSFRTETLNLSLSGALIEKPAPESFLNKTVEIVLVFSPTDPHVLNPKKELLRFKGIMITGCRLAFMTDIAGSHDRLQKIISSIKIIKSA